MSECKYVAASVKNGSLTFIYGAFDGESHTFIQTVRHLASDYYNESESDFPFEFTIPDILNLLADFLKQRMNNGDDFKYVGLSVYGNVHERSKLLHVDNRDDERSLSSFDVKSYLQNKISKHDFELFLLNETETAAIYEIEASGTKGSLAFIELGHGVNAGFISQNDIWSGHLNPEMAHFFPRYHAKDSAYVDFCNSDKDAMPRCIVHKDCLLGLTGRRGLMMRLDAGMDMDTLQDIYAYYIAQLCVNITLMMSPDKIILGPFIFTEGALKKYNCLDKVKTMEAINYHFRTLMDIYPIYPQSAKGRSEADLVTKDEYIICSERGANASMLGLVTYIEKQSQSGRAESS